MKRTVRLVLLLTLCGWSGYGGAAARDGFSPVDRRLAASDVRRRSSDSQTLAPSTPPTQPAVYRHQVVPHWFAEGTKFWYRNDLANGAREFVVVDAERGTRTPAFDHVALAQALGNDVRATHLPVNSLAADPMSDGWLIHLSSGEWKAWDAVARRLTPVAKEPDAANSTNDPSTNNERGRRRRRRAQQETSVTFVNQLKEPVEIFWLADDGTSRSYGQIAPGVSHRQHTFVGHRWHLVAAEQGSLGQIVAEANVAEIVVDGRKFAPVPEANSEVASSDNETISTQDGRIELRSPDGAWIATVEQHNVVIRAAETQAVIVASTDGRAEDTYDHLVWAPDSKTLVAFRIARVEVAQVHLVQSSPATGGRARLTSRPYALPGDPFPRYELNLFRVETKEHVRPEVERFEHEWLRPEIRFDASGRISYEQTDRGHGRFRLFEVELASGQVRTVIDEKSPTFIWTAHTESLELARIYWLDDNRLLYATEKNGWRQLLRIDARSGREVRVLTPPGLVVRGVHSFDPDRRRVWLAVSGRPDQDPYFVHYAAVDVESGEWTWLTEGNGDHSIESSPDRRFVIDTYSRVDAGPTVELRRVADGQRVCALEQADLTELVASGWKPPEVFVAKGRDGQTDIWGIICRPCDFDPQKKYPVIEDIYAGPQDSYVPKSFSPRMRYDELTRLGFIVVKLDGMGTANRSKAFHDVCWRNLKDAGFPDRIAWIKSAAARYPEMDLSRVGIYGGSAGGQNAAAAVLFHSDFYHVAVAGCGCHDNRMDKASWNEQWMGYPVGPQYAECSNIDNAHRLGGKLLLIVGELDDNVPPESTLRFVDALVRAEKDFEMLVVPNEGHGMGGAYGQRRLREFFIKHLVPESPSTASASNDTANSQQSASAESIVPRATLLPGDAASSELTSPNKPLGPPPAEFFQLVAEPYRPAARGFYKKYLDAAGVPVVAAPEVDDQALWRTHEIVTHLLAARPDITQAMQRAGMYLIIIGRNQVYTDMPEYRDHPNPKFQNERVRGTGGLPTSFGEENLLSLTLDRYDDESIAVHEFCHTIDGALGSLDATWESRLDATYLAARQHDRYELAYAGSNAGEYWAEICQAYFDCNRVNNWNHGPVGTREQLKAYDPLGYELVRSVFQLSPSQDWRYRFVRTLPCVESPPPSFSLDPYYTKFSWAREMTIVGREASDEAMLRANHIVRHMFAYRHDLLKAFIANGTRIVVLGKNESLSELPELRQIESGRVDLLARFLEYSSETKILVVSEENLLAGADAIQHAENHLVRLLAHAIHQITGLRAEDPTWNDRPRDLWQQYELRVQRLDVRFDQQLQHLYERAMAAGKWHGTAAATDRTAYWVAGVLAYFDAAGQSVSPADAPHGIETREELAGYDPELHTLVHTTMAFQRRTDWRVPRR